MTGLRINGQLHYVADQNDFIDLVSRYMGMDAEQYLRDLLQECESESVDYSAVYSAIEDAQNSLDYALSELGVC